MQFQYLKRLKLPDSPGVYIFRDYAKRPIYIGRATSLRDRTRSYFSADLIETRGPRIVDLVTKAKTLTFEATDSILEAIILESTLIKRYQPHYNIDDRDDKSHQYVVITDEDWPRVFLVRARDFDQARREGTLDYKIKKCFGPFTESGTIKEALKILRHLFPFRDKKANDPRHEAFYRAIGQSPEKENGLARERYLETIKHLILFFEGKKGKLRIELEEEMNDLANEMRFEEAEARKRLIYALDHINDISLIKRERGQAPSGFRIEAYDIAHLSGTNVVGVMTVFVNGEPAKDQYRKFKIKVEANNDLAGLAEVLFRRLNHPEWNYPDLIVVDGNKLQLETAENVLKARRINLPIVALTKDAHHKASAIIGHADFAQKFKNEIIAVNAEAHRFAIGYHRQRRGKGFV
ncbi:MAG: GIY-YIG nuclease family protein [Candidatus Paceibacterota bacterium]